MIEGGDLCRVKWDKKESKNEKQGVGAPCFCYTQQEKSLRSV